MDLFVLHITDTRENADYAPIFQALELIIPEDERDNYCVNDVGNVSVVLPFHLSEKRVLEFKQLLESFDLVVSYRNVTQQILFGDYEDEALQLLIEEGNFACLCDEYREQYLTVDVVLDKLNAKGQAGLTELDWAVLKKGAG